MSYWVEFHESPDDVVPPPSYDASRKEPPPGPSREKLRRVLKEEAKRSAYQNSRLPAYTKATWDAVRPAGPNLPYFEYTWTASEEPTALRDDVHYAGKLDDTWSFLAAKAKRIERCTHTAWHSRNTEPYDSLGNPELVPAAMKRRPISQPLTIRGDAWVPEAEKDRGELVPLVSGTPVEDYVVQTASKFFCVEAFEYCRITLRLTVHAGDPDLFVCKTADRPDADHYTWRSLEGGEYEVMHIEPDDPNGGAGTYYIAVYGNRASDFKLVAELSKPPIALPPKPPNAGFNDGYKDLHRALRASRARLTHATAGGTNLSSVEDLLSSRGQPAARVVAAARPAAKALRAYSHLALQQQSTRDGDMSRALSQSLSSLQDETPPPRTAPSAARSGSTRAAPGPAVAPAAPAPAPALTAPSPAPVSAAPTLSRADSEPHLPSSHDADRPLLTASGSVPALLRPPRERRLLNEGSDGATHSKAATQRRCLVPDPAPVLQWHPPRGYTWEDLPSEARLVQALNETHGAKATLVQDLQEQLGALERLRPYKHVAQTFSLASLDPTSSLCRQQIVREGASAMLSSYARQRYPAGGSDEAATGQAANEAASSMPRPRKRVPFTEHAAVRIIDERYAVKPRGLKGGIRRDERTSRHLLGR